MDAAATARTDSLSWRARRTATSTWLLGGIVFAITWGGGMQVPYTPPSLDYSLHSALNMAAIEGLNFGTEFAFTYGPLGFLKSYMIFYEWPARLAVIYGVALHLALSLTLVWALRRNFGLAIALVLAVVLAALARGDELAVGVRDDAGVVILAFAWCIAALSNEAPDFARRVAIFGGGTFAAIEMLAKLNTGLLVLTLVLITAVAVEGDRRRNAGIAIVSFLGSLTILWFASGQGVGNLAGYFSSGFELIAGYSSGARFEWNDHTYDYWLAALLIGLAAAIAWIGTRGVDSRRRAAILLIVALVSYTGVKSGFVAHDIYHMATFYPTMIALLCVLPLSPVVWPRIAVLTGAAIGIVGATTTFYTTSAPYPMADPVANTLNGARTIATMIDERRLDAQIAANRAHLQASYALDPEAVRALAGHSVHVDPSEASAVWAYGFEWQPLPVFQPYAAWTAGLDDWNADATADAAGPERVLRQNLDALGRFPAFESPSAMLALLCHFEPLHTTPTWQVLGRVEDRCGDPRPLATHTGTFGAPIPIPDAPPGHVIFARTESLELSGLERLRSTVFRSQNRQVVFEGDPFVYNFLPGTSGNDLLLGAAPGIDYPEPYSLAPAASSVTFLFEREALDRKIALDFYAMPVRAAMRASPTSDACSEGGYCGTIAGPMSIDALESMESQAPPARPSKVIAVDAGPQRGADGSRDRQRHPRGLRRRNHPRRRQVDRQHGRAGPLAARAPDLAPAQRRLRRQPEDLLPGGAPARRGRGDHAAPRRPVRARRSCRGWRIRSSTAKPTWCLARASPSRGPRGRAGCRSTSSSPTAS